MKKQSKITNVKKLTDKVKCYNKFNQNRRKIIDKLCLYFEDELNRLINKKEF